MRLSCGYPNPPRYLLYRAPEPLGPFLVGTWEVRDKHANSIEGAEDPKTGTGGSRPHRTFRCFLPVAPPSPWFQFGKIRQIHGAPEYPQLLCVLFLLPFAVVLCLSLSLLSTSPSTYLTLQWQCSALRLPQLSWMLDGDHDETTGV